VDSVERRNGVQCSVVRCRKVMRCSVRLHPLLWNRFYRHYPITFFSQISVLTIYFIITTLSMMVTKRKKETMSRPQGKVKGRGKGIALQHKSSKFISSYTSSFPPPNSM
jgi:hypothetical protein